MGGQLVTVGIKVLHLTVIGPFMRDVERRGDGTPIRVLSTPLKQVAVQLFVKIVNGVVERKQYDLWRLVGK